MFKEITKKETVLENGEKIVFHVIDLGEYGTMEIEECDFDTKLTQKNYYIEKELTQLAKDLLKWVEGNKCALHIGNRDKNGRRRKISIGEKTNTH